MLVLSRYPGQSIIVGEGDDKIVVTVVSRVGDKIRIGITAPRDVPVHREEIHEQIEREKRHEDTEGGRR